MPVSGHEFDCESHTSIVRIMSRNNRFERPAQHLAIVTFAVRREILGGGRDVEDQQLPNGTAVRLNVFLMTVVIVQSVF